MMTEKNKAIARTKRKPDVANVLAAALNAGGKPSDVPRFVPDGELNTGPRDERGQLRPGEPRPLADRLADLFEHGGLRLEDRNGETYTLSNRDRDAVVEALRTAGLFEDALNVCQMVAKASMSETRPSRGESSIGWQKGDGVNSHEVCLAARRVIAGARALKSDGGL